MKFDIREMAKERVILCAHRGVWGGNIPCNNTLAYDIAIAQGADMVEIDVTMAADSELFVFHPGMEHRHLGKNVHLHKTFLQQSEIAQLHKTCGVFLSTKRMDTQGVSRDEAMSSGLVPIASDVAAVPEFVDGSCGILTPGEEYKPVAEAIKRLYHDPELFEQLSENAAKRVRSQTGRPYTIAKELELICREK